MPPTKKDTLIYGVKLSPLLERNTIVTIKI